MASVYPILGKFNFGETSPLIKARVDHQKYSAGCKVLENFIPLLQGPVQRRGGTRMIAQANNGANPVLLIDFAFSETTSYLLELGNYYMRVYTNGGPVYTSGTTVYQRTTPWAQADLFGANGISSLKWVQSGDTMYIVCPNRAPQKLMRYGPTDWRIEALPGWNTVTDTRANATAIALFRERLCLASGQTVWMSQSGAFENFHIAEALFNKITLASNYITSVNSTTGRIECYRQGSVQYHLSFMADEVDFNRTGNVVTCSTKDGVESFSRIQFDITAYTSAGDLAEINATQGQIIVGPKYGWGTITWDSRYADIERDYSTERGVFIKPATDVISADDPLEIDIYSEQMDRIEWMVAASNLVVGTSGGEFHIGETTTVEPMGPDNIRITPETVFGSSSIQALRVGSVILFVQRSGRKLREFTYNLYGDNFQATDTTVAAEHITGSGLTAMVWQMEPIETLWCVRADGQLIGFTYSSEQDMTAWHRHQLGGNGKVSQCQVLPAGHGMNDELWLSVKRVVSGTTRYYIEKMESGHYDSSHWGRWVNKIWTPGATQADAFFVDCGTTVTGTAMTEVTGLTWLEGYEVAILGDGGPQPRQVVTGGRVPLKYPVNKVQIGLPYDSVLTTVNLDLALRDGTAQGRTKRITKVTLDIINSLGGQAGRDDEIEGLQFRMGYDPLSKAPALRSGFFKVLWPYGFEREGELTVKQTYPLPFVLAAILPEVDM